MNPIITFEEHGEVLQYWASLKIQHATLIYFDQHLDLKAISSPNLTKISRYYDDPFMLSKLNRDLPFRDNEEHAYGLDNFLYAAAYCHLFKRVIWVVPEVNSLSLESLQEILIKFIAYIPDPALSIASSLSKTEHSICFTIFDTVFEVTTLSRLNNMQFPDNTILDIDLDYFLNLTFFNKEIDCFVEFLQSAGLVEHVHTLTYSISSGFLPEAMRGCAKRLASLIGRELLPPKHTPSYSTEILNKFFSWDANSDQAKLAQEIEAFNQFGGAGCSLKSVFSTKCGNFDLAERLYWQARECGDRASWPAYVLGTAFHRNQQYPLAIKWYELSRSGRLIDTLHGHSLVMEIIARSKYESIELFAPLVELAINNFPLSHAVQAFKSMKF